MERWTERLATLGAGKKVGVCWRSGMLTPERRRHYPAWNDWRPVWRTPGITWINLQYDECEAELVEAERATGVRIHRWPGEDLRNDFESVVALMRSLDLVVTAPTAVSSLAGAAGVPTWQLDNGSDWTVFGEDRSPWFPSISLRRMIHGERSWQPTLERLAVDLGRWVEGGAP